MPNENKSESGCVQTIAIISVVSAFITIFSFATGIFTFDGLIKLFRPSESPASSPQATAPIPLQQSTPTIGISNYSQSPTSITVPSDHQAISPFYENFNADTLDTSKWTRENSDGEISVGGSLKLSSSTGTFPYIHSTGQVFPTDGDFQFEVRFRYPNPDACGVGILLTTYNIPVGLSQSETEIVQHENEMNGFTTGIWQDATTGMHIWFRSAADVVEKPVYGAKSNSDWHLLTIVYSNSRYSIFLDKANNPSPIYESPMMLYHPEFITFGHAAAISTCAGHWSTLEVGDISVKSQ